MPLAIIQIAYIIQNLRPTPAGFQLALQITGKVYKYLRLQCVQRLAELPDKSENSEGWLLPRHNIAERVIPGCPKSSSLKNLGNFRELQRALM